MTQITDFLNAWVPHLRAMLPPFGATLGISAGLLIAAVTPRRIVALVILGWILALVTLAVWLTPPIRGAWTIAGLIAVINALAFTVTPSKKTAS